MSKIIVGADGLYRDGVKLKLEFGNLEQIEALRNFEKKMASFKKEGVSPRCDYEVKGEASFFCVCGRRICTEKNDAESEEDIECFEGIEETCKDCKRKYIFKIEKDWMITKVTNKRYSVNERLVVVFKD
jgi:hypothetical protein